MATPIASSFGKALLGPLLDPLLNLPSSWAVGIVAFLVTLIITLGYKFFTNQKLMKHLKGETKRYQQEMKKHKSDSTKMMQVQKELMDVNLKYFVQSLRPTLVTLIPIILIFAWLHASLAFEPIHPFQEFHLILHTEEDVTGTAMLAVPEGLELLSPAEDSIKDQTASWKLKGNIGKYVLFISLNDKEFSKEVLITDNQAYATVEKVVNENGVKTIKLSNERLDVITLFGRGLSWFWAYILFSVLFSIGLRKVLNVH